MIEAIGDMICGVVTNDGMLFSEIGHWQSYALHPPKTRVERVLHRFGLSRSNEPLSNILARSKPDVLFFNYLSFARGFEKIADRSGLPVVCHAHGFDVYTDLRHNDDPNKKVHNHDYASDIRRMGEKWTIIANSLFLKGKLIECGVPEKNIELKFFGVDEVDGCIRKRTRLESDIGVLYLGRLVDFKGPDLTIKSFDLACDRGFQGYLTLAGDGPLRATIELARAASKWADRIQILGAVDGNRGNYLRLTHNIFTAHSRIGPISRQEEAFGVAFIEAMASGLPVVTGKSGGLPEIVNDQVTGILFEPGSVEEHATALLELSRDHNKREKMGKKGRERAKLRFSRQQESARLREIISSAVRKG
ncbi:glycosyltransferase [Rhodobacterales bacterium HKCCSP123]|nr:glycosyltransferase [Rhodobacterales bacterium HKCCSP123]